MRERARPGKSRERCKFYHLSLLTVKAASAPTALRRARPHRAWRFGVPGFPRFLALGAGQVIHVTSAAVLSLHLSQLMQTRLALLVGLLIVVVAVPPAAAQRRTSGRTPVPGMLAVGASIGADIPSNPALDNGLDIAGTIEG